MPALQRCLRGTMGGSQPSKLAESSAVTGLSYLEDGQFAKIYKVTFIK